MKMKIKDLELHELVEIFPPMQIEEFEAFKLDVKARGITEPITVYNGKVIDGRHRLIAAKELNFKEIPVNIVDKLTEEEAYIKILGDNSKRRNLNPGQLALIGLKHLEVSRDTSKRRKGTIAEQVNKSFGPGIATIKRVQFIIKNGNLEEVELVRSGESTANTVQNSIKKRLSPPIEKEKDSSNNITTKEQELENEAKSLKAELNTIKNAEMDKKIQYIKKHGNDVQRQATGRKDPKVIEKIYKVVHDTYTTKGMNPSFPPPTNKIGSAVGNKDYDELKKRFDVLNEDYDKLLDKCMELETSLNEYKPKPEIVRDYTKLTGADITPEELDRVKLYDTDPPTYRRLIIEWQRIQNAK